MFCGYKKWDHLLIALFVDEFGCVNTASYVRWYGEAKVRVTGTVIQVVIVKMNRCVMFWFFSPIKFCSIPLRAPNRVCWKIYNFPF